MNHNQGRAGALAALTASMLIFGTIGLFRRWIPVSSGLLAFTRAVLGTLFLLGLRALGVTDPGRSETPRTGSGRSESTRAGGWRSEPTRKGGGRQVFLLPLSGALLGLNWMLLFEAYRHTTVAIATLCYYMQPTILIFLSPLLFREPLRGKQLICALLSVAGMVLVSGVGAGVGTGALDGLGIGLGLAAAALYALIIVLNKTMGPVDPWRRTVVQLTAAACALLPYVLLTGGFQGLRLSGGALAALLVVGVVHTGVAYALYFSSMGKLPAQTLALFSYIDPVTALLLSALVLGEALSTRGCVGAALILACAVFGEVSKDNP